MRAMRKLPVVPICRRYRRLRRRANQNDLLAHPASMKRDVRAVVTTREAGMRWTRMARQTNVACADGEVAWSRPPDAETREIGLTDVPYLRQQTILRDSGNDARGGLLAGSRCLPLCSQTRTLLDVSGASHLCQKQTIGA